MSALEWLDWARADLDAATPGPWSIDASTVHGTFWVTLIGDQQRVVLPRNDARLIASAPDRLDRMERALRGVMDLHRRSGCREPWDTCPTMTAIEETLGDE